MAISDYLFEKDPRGNIPALDLAQGILGFANSRRAGGRVTDALQTNQWDASYQQMFDAYNAQLKALTGAAADPNSPEFQSRLKTRMDEIMRGYTDALRQQSSHLSNRAARGAGGVWNPERQDERFSRNIATGLVEAEARARAEVMQELLAAAQGSSTAMQRSGPVAGMGLANERARAVTMANAQNNQDATSLNSILALAKGVVPLVSRGMDLSKASNAATVANAANQGYMSDAEAAARGGRPLAWPGQGGGSPPLGSSSGSWDMPPGNWGQSNGSWDVLPDPSIGSSNGSWDMAPDLTTPVNWGGLPTFESPNPNVPDLGDWWAMDSSVDFGGQDWGGNWW